MPKRPYRVTFEQPGDFAAISAARRWLESAGYSVGAMQAGAPMGIKRGDWLIQKWRNLSPAERAGLDGQITGDMRYGPVVVEIYDVATIATRLTA